MWNRTHSLDEKNAHRWWQKNTKSCWLWNITTQRPRILGSCGKSDCINLFREMIRARVIFTEYGKIYPNGWEIQTIYWNYSSINILRGIGTDTHTHTQWAREKDDPQLKQEITPNMMCQACSEVI